MVEVAAVKEIVAGTNGLSHTGITIIIILALAINKLLGLLFLVIKKRWFEKNKNNRREPYVTLDYLNAHFPTNDDLKHLEKKIEEIVTTKQCEKCNMNINKWLEEHKQFIISVHKDVIEINEAVAFIKGKMEKVN